MAFYLKKTKLKGVLIFLLMKVFIAMKRKEPHTNAINP